MTQTRKQTKPKRVTVSGTVALVEAEELDRISRRPATRSYHVGRAVSEYLARLRRKSK